MKIGNVSQNVLKRTILKTMSYTCQESIIQPSVEEMCGGIMVKEDEDVIFTSTSIYGKEKNLGVYGVAKVANDLATRGAIPLGIQVIIQLPPFAYESRLKAMMEMIENACSKNHMQIFTARAEVNPIISQSIVFVTGVGRVNKKERSRNSKAEANQDIVVTKWIGIEGMQRIVNVKEEELKKRFVPGFMKQMKSSEQELFALKEIAYGIDYGVRAMHQIGSGGILAALWELGEAVDLGLRIMLKEIPIRQETIEVCEYIRINPYQLTSTGCILMIADKGENLVTRLAEQGLQATVIGQTTKEKERVILGGEEKRFIDRPQPDELVKIYQEYEEEV